MTDQILLRQVDTPEPGVLAHVADDVGKLEGQPQPVGVLQRLRILIAEDGGRHLADHAGSPTTVELQPFEIQVAFTIQVHAHAVDDLHQLAAAQTIRLQERLQGTRDGMGGCPVKKGAHFLGPPVELAPGHIAIALRIGHVIDLAAVGVERGDGAPPLGRQEEKAVVEAGTTLHCLVLAVFIRCHENGVVVDGKRGQA